MSECNFRIEFAIGSAALDASARRAIQTIAARASDSGKAVIHGGIAPGEDAMLITARYDAIRGALLRVGLPQAVVTQIVMHHVVPSAPPSASVHVCAAWDSPRREWRAAPGDPQHPAEYRVGNTTMRIPLALLGPYVWNDVPLEPPINPPTLFLSRDGGTEADIPTIRRRNEGPDRDAACRNLIRATLRSWLWTPELDPPSYRLPASGSREPSPRARFSFTVSRSHSRPGPANYVARFIWRDGGRTVAEGECTRFDIIARTDASAFISDRQAHCVFRMLRLTPTAGAGLLFWIDNLEEVPAIVERTLVAIRRYVAPSPPP